jgi:Universal stress protein UspA and related nucleotide-binding proteins
MKKILVPCDFSEPAMEAYRFAMNIAEMSSGEVYVLKVIDLPFSYETTFGTPTYHFHPTLIKELEADAQILFDRMKNNHARKEGVTLSVLQGPVTFTIQQFIEDHKIDLVVMGTHGASGWKEYWVGSNTEKVVRFSSVPVLAIRKANDLLSIRNIVVPTTLELDQTELMSKIKELQSFFSATLNLLLVNTPYNMMRTKDEMDMMREFALHYKLKDYTLNLRNDYHEDEGIINFAKEINADLIAMGTHARKGLSHLLAGSVAEDVLNHVPFPIWTYSIQNKSSKITKPENELEVAGHL